MIKKIAMAVSAISLSAASFAATLPDTPVPFKSGAGAMIDNVIYIGLGTAGNSWYKIDLTSDKPVWQSIALFPGQPRDQAQAVALDGKLYVFGGVGKESAEATRISVSNEVYCYDPKKDSWQLLPTRSPVGLTGHAAIALDKDNAVIVGSVNKEIFDGLFYDLEKAQGDEKALAQINADYIGKEVKDYFFNEYVLSYDAKNNLWHKVGTMPIGGTAGSAIAKKDNVITVVNGERKPGLRTAKALQFSVDKNVATFSALDDMCPANGESVQDGVAGAFAGYSGYALLVAGGANFPGSTKAYEQGHNFAHEGLTKTWRDEIYMLLDGKWVCAGKLPQPLGYGVSIEYKDGVLLVGGETTGGQATSAVQYIYYKDGKVNID